MGEQTSCILMQTQPFILDTSIIKINVTPQFNKVQLPTGHINLINRTARWKKGVSDFLGPIFVFRGLKWTQLAPVTMAD